MGNIVSMLGQETFKWMNFQNHLTLSVKDLLRESNFSDVTLVTNDQIQIQAHKLVLSASSPVLKDILINTPHSHPIIYLRGVNKYELEKLLDFIYYGEAIVLEARVKEFRSIANDLHIKDFTQGFLPGESIFDKEDISLSNQECKIEGNLEYISGDKIYKCELCESSYETRPGLITHTRAKHEGLRYSCNKCEYRATQLGGLKRHQEAKHKGKRYSCNYCDYLATAQSSLKRHLQSLHKGIRYSCHLCNYQASTKDDLHKHQESIHEGLRYSCDQCDYQATQQSNLNTHKKSIHQGHQYDCNMCEYQTGWKRTLRKHKQEKHILDAP